MPQLNPDIPPPFDQGVFLMHYNRGREAFQEGRYAEARRELESAQRLRPDDSDVLNLLGLVYFKTNAFPEAEVIYRRLADENPNVFILHSNLGLILFKQNKLDEAERYLLRSIQLRPNYSKSHLYLGLLYKQKKKFGLALEHLKFAGADKAIREIEQEMKGGRPAAPVVPEPPPPQPVAPVPPPPSAPAVREQKRMPLTDEEIIRAAADVATRPGNTRVPGNPVVTAKVAAVRLPEQETVPATQTAARKLQEAVDETREVEQPRLDLDRKIEGASKTFALHENGFLEINFSRSVYVKRGTVSSYSGNLKFSAEAGLSGTTAGAMVRVEGSGKLFAYEKGRKTFLLDLNDEFIYVEGGNLLALEDSLSFRVEPIYDTTYQRKIDTVKIFGKGSLAISTSIEPLTLRVTPAFPLSISSNALVAWTGNVIPAVMEDDHLASVMIDASEQSFKIRFEGDGVVVSEN
jgi:uncharacterized protein (AIM24 family)